jgi:hypothetical protein
MDELLGNIYTWFDLLFGQYLGEYLWGYNCGSQAYTNENLFNSIGLTTLFVSLLFVLIYYYLINHPRFNKWGHWSIVLILSGIINFFIAYRWILGDFLKGAIDDCLMYKRDEEGSMVSQLIFESDCRMFGISNFIVSALFFILLSFIFKWWSHNCKHSPFL